MLLAKGLFKKGDVLFQGFDLVSQNLLIIASTICLTLQLLIEFFSFSLEFLIGSGEVGNLVLSFKLMLFELLL